MNRKPATSSILRAAKGVATAIAVPAALVAVASVRLQAPKRERLAKSGAPPAKPPVEPPVSFAGGGGSTPPARGGGRGWPRRFVLLVGVVAVALIGVGAWSFWSAGANSTASANASARSMSGGHVPVPAATSLDAGHNLGLSWAQNTFPGASPLGGASGGSYMISRYGEGGSTPFAPPNCASLISGSADPLGCTEDSLPTGHWQYTVTPAFYNWRGSESGKSAVVVVSPNAPTSATLANGVGVGNAFVNTSNASSVSIDVGVSATSLPSDTVHVTLDDGQDHTASGSHAASDGAGTVHVTGIDASGLADGSITITAKVTSAQGDDSGDKTGDFILDKTAPHVIVTADRAPDSNGWYNHLVTFGAGTSNDANGIQSCDAGVTYSGPDTASGLRTLQCLDNAGNTGSGSLVFKFDHVRPTTTAAIAPIFPTGSNGWYIMSPTYTLTATDATSGVASTSYQIGGGSTHVYTGPFSLPDGSYKNTYSSVDFAGNTESTHTSGTIKVDTVKPSTSLTLNPASPNGTNGWYAGSSPTFTLAATDATSGVASTSYRIDGGAVQTYSGAVTVPDGIHTITFWSVDNAGNVEDADSASVMADTVAPTSSIAVSPASPDGSNSWYVTTPTFTLSGVDGLSGLDSLKYQIDGGATQTYGGAVPIADGTHTISYWALDKAGNVEGTHTSATIKVDTAKPSTTIAVNPASPNGSNGWYSGSAPTFTLSASDPAPGSGVATTKYQIDAGSVQSYSSAVTIPDGQHTISYWSVDAAGNTESTHTSATIKVDTVKPSTSLLINPLAPNGTNGWYKTTAPTFTLTAADTAGSGVASTSYRIDGGATLPYSGAVTVPEGQHTISYWSTDAAANVETTHTTATIKVDVTKPTDSLSFGAATGAFLSGTTIYFKGNSTTGSFNLTDTVADAGSGAAFATFPATLSAGFPNRWSVTGGGTVSTPAGGPFSALFAWSGGTPATPSPITISSQDAAANVSTGTALSFVNDSTAPTGGALTVNGSTSNSTTTKTTFPINSRIDYTDAGSGLASSVLTVQSESLSGSTCGSAGSGGPFVSPTTIIGMTQPTGIVNGFCYLYVLTGTDHVGNVATLNRTVAVPTLTIAITSHTGGPGHRDNINGTTNVTTGTVTVKIYAGSTATGTAVLTLTDSTLTAGTWSVQSGNSALTNNGTYTAQATQVDGDGTTSNQPTNTFTAS
jgi:hypothetical protein